MIYPDDDEPDYVTIAYDARTGAERWVQRYSGHPVPPPSANLRFTEIRMFRR